MPEPFYPISPQAAAFAAALGTRPESPKFAEAISKYTKLGYTPEQWPELAEYATGKRGVKPLPAAPPGRKPEAPEAPPSRPMNKDEAVTAGWRILTGQDPNWRERVDIGALDDAAAASRQFARGIGDSTTLGMANEIVDSPGDAEADAARLASDPVLSRARVAGGVNGALLPVGAANAAGKVGASVGRAAGNAVSPLLAKAIGPTAGRLVGAIGSGALSAGTAGAVMGGWNSIANADSASSAADVLLDAVNAAAKGATDPTSLKLGAGLGGASALARAVSGRIRNPNTRTGEIIEAAKKAGGEPSPIPGQPVRPTRPDSAFASPEVQNTPPGHRGTIRTAQRAGDEYMAHNDATATAAGKKYNEAIDDILSSAGKVPAKDIHAKLDEAMAANMENGVVADEGLQRALVKAKRMLGGVEDGAGGWAAPETVDASSLLRVRKLFKKGAGFESNQVTEDMLANREAYGILAEAARGADPRIGPILDEYGSTMNRLKRANDIVVGQKVARLPDNRATSDAVTQQFVRIGDESAAAAKGERYLEELAALDPKYKELIDRLGAVKVREMLRYFPEGVHAGELGEAVAGAGEHGLLNSLKRLVNPDVDAVAVRLVDPAARALANVTSPAGTAPGTAVNVNRVLQANAKQREQDRRRAEALRKE